MLALPKIKKNEKEGKKSNEKNEAKKGKKLSPQDERLKKKRDEIREKKRIIEDMYDEDKRIESKKSNNYVISGVVGGMSGYTFGYAASVAQDEAVQVIEALKLAITNIMGGEYLFTPHPLAILAGVLGGGVVGAGTYFYLYTSFNEKYSHDPKSIAGTGGFMSKKQLKKYKLIYEDNDKFDIYIDPVTKEEVPGINTNMIFGVGVCRSLNPKVSNRNNNLLIIGAPGTGKSFMYIKPNILQMNASYVVTDPKGELLADTGSMLAKNGYKVKIFNLVDMNYSNTYNPFNYLNKEEDLLTMVDCFISNTTNADEGKGEKFWTDSEKLLYSACICYLLEEQDDASKRNFGEILKMINSSAVNEDGRNQEASPLDKKFEKLPDESRAKQYYKGFCQSPSKTRMGIIISCITRLQPFMIESVVNLTSSDNIHLDKIGDEKTALFIVTPEGDNNPYNFLASMMYTQLFDALYYVGKQRKAETGSERMIYPVRCMMDEFANIGTIPGFTSKLSTMRGYNIGAEIVIQDLSQLENRYKEDWETIIGDCDGLLYLGTNSQKTNKYISELLGNKTVVQKNKNRTKGSKGSTSTGLQTTKREVMTPDELGRIPNDVAILFTRGERPIKMKKYKGIYHPRWKEAVAETYNYKEISVYDNRKIATGNASAMLRSKQESSRYRSKLEISDATDPNVLNEMDINIILNQTEFSEDVEAMTFKILCQEAIQKVVDEMQDGFNLIKINVIDDVAPKMLEEITRQTIFSLGLDNLILFANNRPSNKMYGVGISETDPDFDKKIKTKSVKSCKKKNDAVYIEIDSSDYDRYGMELQRKNA